MENRSSPKKTVTIRLPIEYIQMLDKISELTGASKTEIIKRAIKEKHDKNLRLF